MIRLRRHSAFVLLAVLLIGGLPLLHSAQHVAEYAEADAPMTHEQADTPASKQGTAVHATAQAQADCDLCAHMLYGTPTATQPPAVLQDVLSEKTRLRSRVVQATPYHFVIRGPPAHA